MYNVLIVDDEPVIRFGLKASVNWNQEGLNLLGDFPNGEEAFKAMEGHKVDLLITDIKMPIMDGLTLMKKALERFPALKVILVSSYTDFEYVREGLKLGAVDYVLKPTLEPEEFTLLIRKCVKMIDKEQKVEEKLQLINQTTFLKERKNLEQVVKRAILENITMETHQKFEWLQESLLIITMSLNHIEMVEEQFGFLYKTMVLEDIQQYFYESVDEGICFPVGENEILFLLNTPLTPNLVIENLKKEIEKETNLDFSFGYHVIQDLSYVKEGFEKSRSACNRRFFHEDQTIFRYEPLNKEILKPFFSPDLPQDLLSYSKEEWMKLLKERMSDWESEAILPTDIKKEACEIVSHLFMKQIKIELLLEKCEQFKKAETLECLKGKLFQQIEECEEMLQQKQVLPYMDNQIMTKALHYIHEHYTDELTLQMVANYVHISRNYFSVLFKRFNNQNFIDYVIDLRIKKAKKLLKNTSLRVYEIAELSGFKDVKHFSKLFKKLVGFSPGDFRTKHHQK